ASFGIIGLQTAFAVLNTQLKKHLPTDKIVEKFTAGPRRVLGLPAQTIDVGEKAVFTIFDPERKWVFTRKTNLSKSANSPFFDQELIGQPIAVVNKGEIKRVN
ncbi:MAG TPA: dihydroorotase, partial [Luteibaculaceae bacterium]|nr:dihydroorotase [Luteibaculaceae bacterium]